MDWTFDLTFHSHNTVKYFKFQKISILPQKKGLETTRGGGSHRLNSLKKMLMYEALLEFPERGGGGLRKNQSIDGFHCHATKKKIN